MHRCAASCIQTGKASSRREFTYISGCAARAYGIARLDGLQELRAQLLRDGGVGLPDLCQLLHNFSSKLHRPHDFLQNLYTSLPLQEVCDFGNAQQEELSALQAATSCTFVCTCSQACSFTNSSGKLSDIQERGLLHQDS